MIVVKLMGGLGNQMFQYAFAKAIEHRRNSEVLIDNTWFANGNRSFVLPQAFNCHLSNATDRQIEIAMKGEASLLLPQLVRSRVTEKYFGRTFTEKKFSFDPAALTSNKRYFVGYWQTYRYLLEASISPHSLFEFKASLCAASVAIQDEIRSNPSASFHVRRGDYVSSKQANIFHGVCEASYYQEALRHLPQNLKIFVFSDDIDWCKDNLHGKNFVFVENHKDKNEWEDMKLMSECQHNVIANSTYSWWSAVLNKNLNKTVIAPKTWFTDSQIDTSDLIPKEWIRC